MIISLIQKKYNDSIKLYSPYDCSDSKLPMQLIEILDKTNGIMETMIHPKTGEQMEIGWIIYPYDEIMKSTSFYKEEYGLNGIVFSDDGAGNPFYLLDEKVYEFDPIDNESYFRADSIVNFFKE